MEEAAEGEGPGYVAGAFAGGLPLGLLGVVTSCCCFFVWPFGGVLGAWVAARRAEWFGLQEGLIAGACTGLVGWLVSAMIALPMQVISHRMIQANPSMLDVVPWPAIREAARQAAAQGLNLTEIVVGQSIMLVLYLGTSALGGALAGQLLLRKEPPA